MISGAQNNFTRIMGMRPSGFRVGPLSFENTRLPIQQTQELGEVPQIMGAISRTNTQLSEAPDYVRTPVLGNIGSYIPGSEAYKSKAAIVPAMQQYGKFMEGGVLREADERKYTRIFPQVGEPKEIIQFKTSLMRRMLAEQYNARLSAFEKAGYDVSEFEPVELPPDPVVSKAFQKQAKDIMSTKESLSLGRGIYEMPDGNSVKATTVDAAIHLQTLGGQRIE